MAGLTGRHSVCCHKLFRHTGSEICLDRTAGFADLGPLVPWTRAADELEWDNFTSTNDLRLFYIPTDTISWFYLFIVYTQIVITPELFTNHFMQIWAEAGGSELQVWVESRVPVPPALSRGLEQQVLSWATNLWSASLCHARSLWDASLIWDWNPRVESELSELWGPVGSWVFSHEI